MFGLPLIKSMTVNMILWESWREFPKNPKQIREEQRQEWLKQFQKLHVKRALD